MRVLITGGTGFIGSHLARRLVDDHEVHVFARAESSTARIAEVESKLTMWRGDITDAGSIQDCVSALQPEIVFHLAGDTSGRRWTGDFSEIDSSIAVNLSGTLNLVRALHALPEPPRRMIRAGGLAEYGTAPVPFDEDDLAMPVSAYGASQAAATLFVTALRSQLRFPIITLRFAAVYGPGRSEDFFLPSLIVHCLAGEEFSMTSGDQPWDLVYIDDAVDSLLSACVAKIQSSEIINIGSGLKPTLREIAEAAVKKIGGDARLRIGAVAPSAGDVPKLYCKIDKARRLLGWEPRVDLDSGLDRTIAWYRERIGRAA